MMSQGGKSKTMEIIAGWKLDTDAEPVLYIGPTRNNALTVVEPKLDDMIRNCESLSKKTLFGQTYTKKIKLVAGTRLRMAWAGSVAEIKADSACVVLVDEVDEITIEVKGQGSIIPLADARHKTYQNGITVAVSTCTTGNVEAKLNEDTGLEHWEPSTRVSSAIWKLWQGGTRHEWAWPCPHCGEYFIPRKKLLMWPENATQDEALTSTFLACPANGCEITQEHRAEMNARGRAVSPGQKISPDGAITGTGIASPDFSMWTSGLANPFITWGEMAAKWIRATMLNDVEVRKAVLNTDFAELYGTGGEAPVEDQVKLCKANYTRGTVPENTRVITMGVDVQGNRLVYVVRAWLYNWESYLIDWGELWGDTSHNEVWSELEVLRMTGFEGYDINLTIVDSGYRSDKVYALVRRNKRSIRAAKGYDKLDKPFYASKVDVTPSKGKVIKNGVQLWHFDTDRTKSWVHSRITQDKDQAGQWHIPAEVDDDYCKQLIAEERVELDDGGFEWQEIGPDNHYLDAEGMAYLGARMLSSRINAPETVEKAAPPEETPTQRIRKARRKSRQRGNKPAWRRH